MTVNLQILAFTHNVARFRHHCYFIRFKKVCALGKTMPTHNITPEYGEGSAQACFYETDR